MLPGLRSRWTIPRSVRLGHGAASDSISPAARRVVPGRAVEPTVEAAAVDVLQLEERQAVGLADVADLDDMGVLEMRDRAGLGQEPRQRLGPGMGAAQDHLDGADAAQHDLAGLVDHAHAAPAQLLQDLVARDGGAGAVGPLARAAPATVAAAPRSGADRHGGAVGERVGFVTSRAVEDRGRVPTIGPIEEGLGRSCASRQRLDSPPELRIGRAFTVQDGGPVLGRVLFDRRAEYGLDASRVERHEWFLDPGPPLPAPAGAAGTISRRGSRGARPGRRPISAERGRR